jgi:hypothetical protein
MVHTSSVAIAAASSAVKRSASGSTCSLHRSGGRDGHCGLPTACQLGEGSRAVCSDRRTWGDRSPPCSSVLEVGSGSERPICVITHAAGGHRACLVFCNASATLPRTNAPRTARNPRCRRWAGGSDRFLLILGQVGVQNRLSYSRLIRTRAAP